MTRLRYLGLVALLVVMACNTSGQTVRQKDRVISGNANLSILNKEGPVAVKDDKLREVLLDNSVNGGTTPLDALEMRPSEQVRMLLWKEKVMSDRLPVPSPNQQVTLLVADDADVIRKTLRNFLKEEPAIKLLGEASNFAETISMTVALKPDVILLDLHMPDDHSFNPEFVKATLCGARVLAMSLASDYASEEDIKLLAENFGAVRTLDKANLCDELIPAILQTEN